jgi:hypothetical protein
VSNDEFKIAGGFCWVVAVALGVAAVVPRSAPVSRLVVVAVAVGAYGAVIGGRAAVASTAGFGCLFYEGFLVNEFGDLAWHGPGTAVRWAVLGAAGLAGYAVHATAGWRRRWREAAVTVRVFRPARRAGHLRGEPSVNLLSLNIDLDRTHPYQR